MIASRAEIGEGLHHLPAGPGFPGNYQVIAGIGYMNGILQLGIISLYKYGAHSALQDQCGSGKSKALPVGRLGVAGHRVGILQCTGICQ